MQRIPKFKDFLDRRKIDQFFKKLGIKQKYYTIRPDGSVDCLDSCILNNGTRWSIALEKLPIQFNKVAYDFEMKDLRVLTLEGAPQSVGRTFDCSGNRLTSLVGGPKYVGGDYVCQDNHLTTFEGFPEQFNYETGGVECLYNPVYGIYKIWPKPIFIYWLNECDVIQENEVIVDRLNVALENSGFTYPRHIKFDFGNHGTNVHLNGPEDLYQIQDPIRYSYNYQLIF